MQFNLQNKSVQLVCAGSATLSALYYSNWAPNIYAALGLGVFAFALDLVKPELFTKTARAFRERGLMAAAAPGAMAVLLFVVSMVAVDGMILKLRSDTSGGLEGVQTKYDRADAEYKNAKTEIGQIGKVQPVAALEAKLESSVPVEVWRKTKQCTDVTLPASRDACKPVFDLREKIANSKRVAELEGKMTEAKTVLSKTDRPKSTDPQVEFIAKVTGWTEAGAVLCLTWLCGFAIELVSSFGPAMLARPPPPEPPPPEPKPEPVLTQEQKALKWLVEEEAKTDGRLIIANAGIAKRFNVDPATVHRWRTKWVDDGLIRERKVGRQIIVKVSRRAQAQ